MSNFVGGAEHCALILWSMHMAAHQSSSKEALRSVVVSCFSAILSGNHQQMKDAEEELKVLQVTEGQLMVMYVG